MEGIKKITSSWFFAVIFINILAATFLFMPYTSKAEGSGQSLGVFLTGSVFWGSLVVGYVSWIISGIACKKMMAHNKIEKTGKRFVPFMNTPTCFIDSVFVLAFIWLLYLVIKNDFYTYSVYIVIFMLISTLNMHFLFSGNIYRSIFNKNNVKGE